MIPAAIQALLDSDFGEYSIALYLGKHAPHRLIVMTPSGVPIGWIGADGKDQDAKKGGKMFVSIREAGDKFMEHVGKLKQKGGEEG